MRADAAMFAGRALPTDCGRLGSGGAAAGGGTLVWPCSNRRFISAAILFVDSIASACCKILMASFMRAGSRPTTFANWVYAARILLVSSGIFESLLATRSQLPAIAHVGLLIIMPTDCALRGCSEIRQSFLSVVLPRPGVYRTCERVVVLAGFAIAGFGKTPNGLPTDQFGSLKMTFSCERVTPQRPGVYVGGLKLQREARKIDRLTCTSCRLIPRA